MPDGELLLLAQQALKSRIEIEAEQRASAVYGFPVTRKSYQFYKDILTATTGFDPNNMSVKLKKVQSVADAATAVILAADDMTLEQIDGYDIDVDPGWPA
jgi:hypothetical protein